MKKWLFEWLFFKVWGWKIPKFYPDNVPQSVVVVFHHTSNWDFPIGILIRPIMNCYINFVGKSSLFWFPLGNLMRWLGGYPVERSKNHNYVEAVANIYKIAPVFRLCVTPEGTRGKVEKLKTGFYYIAQTAQVPIVMCSFDWSRKEVKFSDPFTITNDYNRDIPQILAFFEGIKGKIPANDFDIKKYLSELNSEN